MPVEGRRGEFLAFVRTSGEEFRGDAGRLCLRHVVPQPRRHIRRITRADETTFKLKIANWTERCRGRDRRTAGIRFRRVLIRRLRQ